MKKILMLLLLSVFLLAEEKSHIKPTIEQLFSVKTIQVTKMTTAKKQVNYGYIVAEDSRKFDIHTRFSGYVTTLFANTLYKKVEKGEVLAKVYSPEIYEAKQNYLNSIKFNEKRSVPALLQSAKTKLILLGVSAHEIMLIQKEQKADEFTTIYAPVSGWIFEKNINSGSSFNPQKKLFQIVNLEKVWMEVKLYQNELVKLNDLDYFTVTLKEIQKDFIAQKSLLYPVLNPKEATATLRLILDNDEELLRPGMYAKVNASAEEKSRLVIPHTAAIYKNGSWYAFLVTKFKGEYEPIAIEVKTLDSMYYEVIKGLKDGDKVVNNALFMIDSDAQINGIY